MQFLTITGAKNDIDRMTNLYLSKYEIHLENALTELSSVRDLKPYVEMNPYKDTLVKAEYLIEKLDNPNKIANRDMSIEEAATIVAKAYNNIDNLIL